MSIDSAPSNRSRSEAIAVSRFSPDAPVTVAGQWIDLPSGKPAFKVGVGFTVVSVPNRFAYRGSVIPQARLLSWEDTWYQQGRLV